MTTITIPRALLEQALEVIVANTTGKDALESALRAELAKPADIADEMSAVADQFAHRLALDLECVLADYSGTWYDTAMTTLGAYREAMNAIHERESPTFMGEPLLPKEDRIERCGCCQPFCRSCYPKPNTKVNPPKNKDDLP